MIEIKNLTYVIEAENAHPIEILKPINLTIQPGESIAMMGPNGSGKTTLVRCLNGLLQPSDGLVRVDGMNPADEHQLFEIRKRVGLIFQNPENQIVSSTVEREIAFGLENIGVPREVMLKIVNQMLSEFNLSQYRQHPPHLLSGGEKQRLAIAAVMAMQPRYLILDEPTSLLDPVNREKILRLLKQLHSPLKESASASLATILITQFPEEALIAERLIVMEKGEVLLDGPPNSLFKNVQQFKKMGLGVPVEYEIGEKLSNQGKSETEIWQVLSPEQAPLL